MSISIGSYSHSQDETIAAITTAPGNGAIAGIRVSGSLAIAVIQKLFSKDLSSTESHKALYGTLNTLTGEFLDQVIVIVMRGSQSFTGQETVELFCHGGSIITRRILDQILQAGARSAQPGEFTFRAFMNGKLDLAQAEAVQSIIAAQNDKALDAAADQLQGGLSKEVGRLQETLYTIAAILEAWVDFPEEGLEFASFEDVVKSLKELETKIHSLISSYDRGKKYHEGLKVCLVGRPNVGKSSLMNALLRSDRAIVTDIAGTTRDLIHEKLMIGGIHVQLTDTAGLREDADTIEKEGIRRSKVALKEADLIIWVLDASQGMTLEDQSLIQELPSDKTIAVWNKLDIANKKDQIVEVKFQTLGISAKELIGIELLTDTMANYLGNSNIDNSEGIVITHVRHKDQLQKASQSITSLIQGLEAGVSPEFLTVESRSAMSSLAAITGTDVQTGLLDAIFSNFCIGK